MKNKKKVLLICVFVLFSLFLCSCACSECKGEEKVACETCGGDGRLKCPAECVDGAKGLSCTFCDGIEGIEFCDECTTDHKEMRECETCGGDGVIVNPFTWMEFECNNCDGDGVAWYTCSYCKGYGLICNYCPKDKISAQRHPYYVQCETCSGRGELICQDCIGRRYIPCSQCTPEEYNAFLEELEEYKIKEIYNNARSLYNDGKLDEAEKMFNEIKEYPDAEYYIDCIKQKKEELEIIERTLRPLVGYWQYVSGDASLFSVAGNDVKNNLYRIDIKPGSDEPYQKLMLDFYVISGAKTSKDIESEKGIHVATIQINNDKLELSGFTRTIEVLENGNLRLTQKVKGKSAFATEYASLELKKEV